jgi:hypothetical protein
VSNSHRTPSSKKYFILRHSHRPPFFFARCACCVVSHECSAHRKGGHNLARLHELNQFSEEILFFSLNKSLVSVLFQKVTLVPAPTPPGVAKGNTGFLILEDWHVSQGLRPGQFLAEYFVLSQELWRSVPEGTLAPTPKSSDLAKGAQATLERRSTRRQKLDFLGEISFLQNIFFLVASESSRRVVAICHRTLAPTPKSSDLAKGARAT